jgi:hypothetical protein
MLVSPFASGPEGRWPGGKKGGVEGDFMVILLISLAFEIHFSKG